MSTYYYDKNDILHEIKKNFIEHEILIDVGCGIRPYLDIKSKVHVCIEPWKEYIDILTHCHPKDRCFLFLHTDALTGLQTLTTKSVDAVCFIDVIEHIKKEEGYKLIEEAERVARKQIIIFTSLGFMPNHVDDKDAWGLNGGIMQEHLSGWLPEDFNEGWDFHICEQFHLKSNHHVEIDHDYGCFWAIKNMSYTVQPLPITPLFVKEATMIVTESFLPLVSIIIPVYNGSNYVREAIDSALLQTYDNIEIIVVNDGSTDNTEEIVLAYGDKVKYFYKENGGVATALNLAIEQAQGTYISWLSHDDLYYPEKITKEIDVLREMQSTKREKSIIFSSFDLLQQSTKTKINVEPLQITRENYLIKMLDVFFMSRMGGCTLLIPRQLFYDVGFFDITQHTTQDYSLWMKFFNQGVFFKYISDVLVTSRKHEEQDTLTKTNIVLKELTELYIWAYEMFKNAFQAMKFETFNYFLEVMHIRGLDHVYSYMLTEYAKREENSHKPVLWFYWVSQSGYQVPHKIKMLWKKTFQEKQQEFQIRILSDHTLFIYLPELQPVILEQPELLYNIEFIHLKLLKKYGGTWLGGLVL